MNDEGAFHAEMLERLTRIEAKLDRLLGFQEPKSHTDAALRKARIEEVKG